MGPSKLVFSLQSPDESTTVERMEGNASDRGRSLATCQKRLMSFVALSQFRRKHMLD
jgi:hypothetical protein